LIGLLLHELEKCDGVDGVEFYLEQTVHLLHVLNKLEVLLQALPFTLFLRGCLTLTCILALGQIFRKCEQSFAWPCELLGGVLRLALVGQRSLSLIVAWLLDVNQIARLLLPLNKFLDFAEDLWRDGLLFFELNFGLVPQVGHLREAPLWSFLLAAVVAVGVELRQFAHFVVDETVDARTDLLNKLLSLFLDLLFVVLLLLVLHFEVSTRIHRFSCLSVLNIQITDNGLSRT
jgi:hypothetical protein